jgi:hypothetical protein
MKQATHTSAAAATNRPRAKRASFEEGLRLRIGALLTEREVLMEEVRQLRAAVEIYSEVARRLQAQDNQRAA